MSLATHGAIIKYGDFTAVDEANIELPPGKVTALVGPNGSGKSTLLRAMSRLQGVTQGRISLGNTPDIHALSSKEFARLVTLLAQSRPTPSGLTVQDVVQFGRHPHRHGWRGLDPQGTAAVVRALELTGVADLGDHAVETLSGGQLQRVWFASALAQDTATLLLDEPTNHLDLRYQIEVLQLMRTLADDHAITVGVVLHDLNHAAALADHVVVMDHGRVVAQGEPQTALTSQLLSDVYDIDIEVHQGEHGALSVTTPHSLNLKRVPSAAF